MWYGPVKNVPRPGGWGPMVYWELLLYDCSLYKLL